MDHTFYAYMGGFALDSTGAGRPILPPDRERMQLTPKGVLIALKVKPEILESLLVNDVLDKSKASPLAKAIVCCQALWFCVQCIGRLAESLPLSLLEVSFNDFSIYMRLILSS